MNNPTTELKDLIHVERGIIPSYICNRVVKEIEKGEWSPHQWYNLHEDSRYSEETQELDVQSITDELQKLLNPAIFKALGRYSSLYKYKEALRTDVIYSTAAPVRRNLVGHFTGGASSTRITQQRRNSGSQAKLLRLFLQPDRLRVPLPVCTANVICGDMAS